MNKLFIPAVAVSLAFLCALIAPASPISEPQSQQIVTPSGKLMTLNPLPVETPIATDPAATDPAQDDGQSPTSEPSATAAPTAQAGPVIPDPNSCSLSAAGCFEVVGPGNPLPN